MPHPPWNDHYAAGQLPWDTGTPDPLLVEALDAGGLAAGRALEVGCGTGVNALYLASHGYEVLGVDVAPLAVEQARARLAATPARCRFEVLDFLAERPAGGPFDLVFDRGCFHIFEDPAEQARFAAQVAAALTPGGHWISLAGSTEGPAREVGPPRRSARELVAAIEPALEVVSLRSVPFHSVAEPVAAWLCLARRRLVPAQPSSRHG